MTTRPAAADYREQIRTRHVFQNIVVNHWGPHDPVLDRRGVAPDVDDVMALLLLAGVSTIGLYCRLGLDGCLFPGCPCECHGRGFD